MLVLTLQMIIFWFVASKCRHLTSWFIIIAIHKFVGKGIARRENGALLHPYMHWFLKWSRSLEKSMVLWNTNGNPLFSKQNTSNRANVCLQECVPKLDGFFPSSILTNCYYQFLKQWHIFQKCVTLPHAPKRCFMACRSPRRFRTHSIHLKLITIFGSHVFSWNYVQCSKEAWCPIHARKNHSPVCQMKHGWRWGNSLPSHPPMSRPPGDCRQVQMWKFGWKLSNPLATPEMMFIMETWRNFVAVTHHSVFTKRFLDLGIYSDAKATTSCSPVLAIGLLSGGSSHENTPSQRSKLPMSPEDCLGWVAGSNDGV